MTEASETLDEVESQINKLTTGDHVHIELEHVRLGAINKGERLTIATGRPWFTTNAEVVEIREDIPVVELDTPIKDSGSGDTTRRAKLTHDRIIPLYETELENGLTKKKVEVPVAAIADISTLNAADGGDE